MKHFYTAIAAMVLASGAFAANKSDNVSVRMGGQIAQPKHEVKNLKKARAIAKISESDLTGDIVDAAPDGETKYYAGSSHSFYNIWGLGEADVKGATYEITFTADGKAYWKDPLSQAPFGSYIVGDVQDNKITFQFPQHLYDDYTYADWGLIYEFYVAVFQAVTEDGETSYSAADNQTVTFSIAEDGTISQDGSEIIGLGDFDIWDEYFYFDGYADQNMVLSPFNDVKVEAPASVAFEDWVIEEEYNDLNKWIVKVGFDGSDVYIKGLSADDPDATFKGVVNGDKISVANGQYVGKMYYRYNYTQAGTIKYEYSEDYGREVGFVTNSANDFVFNYDAAAKKMTSPSADDALMISEGNGGESYLAVTVNPSIYDQGEIADYTPIYATITKAEDDWDYYQQIGLRFESSLTNVDGQLLPEENFAYEIYVDGELFTFTAGDPYIKLSEDMTEIPYSFSDDYDIQYTAGTNYHYVYFYFNTMSKLGVRMVYNAPDGNKYYSKMASLNVDFGGVNDINADKSVKAEEYYDLSGRRVDASAKGFTLKRTTFSDGSVTTQKLIR